MPSTIESIKVASRERSIDGKHLRIDSLLHSADQQLCRPTWASSTEHSCQALVVADIKEERNDREDSTDLVGS